MEAEVPMSVLLRQLDVRTQKEMIRTIFAQKHLYLEEDLCEFVLVLPYPDDFWHIVENDITSFIVYTYLWTDSESKCFHNLRFILLTDKERFRNVIYRFVHAVYPKTRQICDLTYDDAYQILSKDPTDVAVYVDSIMPKSRGYIEMKKEEYLEMIENTHKPTAQVGMSLAETLIRQHYHPVVHNFIWWPISKALMVALLREPIDFRERVLSFRDSGWTPRNYIDLCRSPLMWETDKVGADTEPCAGTGGNAHTRDVSV